MALRMRHRMLGALALLLCMPASSQALTLDPIATGWFDDDGKRSIGATYTGRGRFGVLINSYAVFDLTNFGGSVSSFSISINSTAYISDDLEEAFTIRSAAPAPELFTQANIPTGSTAGKAIFQDLGSGDVYATGTVTPDLARQVLNGNGILVVDNGASTRVDLTTTSQALADLNAAIGGYFIIGNALDSPFDTDPGASLEGAWLFPRLTGDFAVVPGPGTGILLGFALIALATRRSQTLGRT